MTQPDTHFVKWDCRAGNAAIGPDGCLRWFDFEYSGLRHGAEDFAWLIADEVYLGAEIEADRTPSFWGMSERVIVMHEGHVTPHFTRAEATQEKIISAATKSVTIG